MRFRRTALAAALALSALVAASAFAAQQNINTGAAANDGTGDTARVAFGKANSNFTELYNAIANLLPTSARGSANGVASLDGNIRVPAAQLGSGTASASTVLFGNGTWGAVSGGAATAYGSVVTLTDGATVTPDATALASPTDVFAWAPPSSGARTLAAPTGVPSTKAQRVRIFVTPAGTGTFALTLGTGISPSSINLPRGSTSEVVLTTSNGGTSWTAEGGGLDLAADTFLGSNASGTPTAMALRQQIAWCFAYAPANGEVWHGVAPFAGRLAGVRGFAAGTGTPTITGTVSINGTAVTSLAAVSYGAQSGNVPLVAAMGANTFAAGDQVRFTHTSAPGGTVTGGCVSAELVQGQ